ncbi:MAG: hypothetical protein CMO44_13455 [Verrucomicrobiales bacterium]|nr:hypothetical protein [Verrucomicrobiales bacterium]
MSSLSKDTEPLLCEMSAKISEWSNQEAVQEMKTSNPERWEKSRQFVLGMQEFERLIKEKLADKDRRVSLLDLECLVCIYNLFLSMSE